MSIRTLFVFDHVNKTIVATETTLKKAGNPNSNEYKELTKMMAERPTYDVVKKVIKVNSSAKRYDGLNTDLIKNYLGIQENAQELIAIYNCILETAKKQKRKPFPMVKRWFLETFEEFNVEKAKQEISKKLIDTAKSTNHAIAQ